MLRIGKLTTLLISLFLLSACNSSSTVDGLSQKEFKEAEKFVNIVDYYFIKMEEMSKEDTEYVENYMNSLYNEKENLTEESEQFYVNVLNLYLGYETSLDFIDLIDETHEDFRGFYKEIKLRLINDYGVSFEDAS